MKDLPPRTLASGAPSGACNMAGGMKEVGVLGMPINSRSKKGTPDKENGSKTTDMYHQDPNTRLIPPA